MYSSSQKLRNSFYTSNLKVVEWIACFTPLIIRNKLSNEQNPCLDELGWVWSIKHTRQSSRGWCGRRPGHPDLDIVCFPVKLFLILFHMNCLPDKSWQTLELSNFPVSKSRPFSLKGRMSGLWRTKDPKHPRGNAASDSAPQSPPA